MTWLHYTSTKIETIQTEFTQYIHMHKPNGLWCSYNNEWMEWCNDSGFYTFDLNNYYLYEAKINDNAKILTIDSYAKYIDNGLDKYKIASFDGKKFDFNKLKVDYDGIAFLNYQQIKLDMYRHKVIDLLLCTLDVNSCCIWNPVYELNLLQHMVYDISDEK